MNRFILNEEESKRIIDLHTRERNKKNLFTEQVSDRNQLQTYVDNGCISGGKVVPLTISGGKQIFAVEKPSTKIAGRIYYYLSDFRFGHFDENGKFVYGQGTWKCPSKTNRDEIEKLKKEQGWMEEKEIGVSITDLSNKEKWETKKVGDVTLYRRISGITATEDLGQEAKDILDGLRKKGWKTADKVPANKRVGGTRLSSLRPDWKQYFSDDLILYPNPNAVARPKNQKPEDIDDTQKFTQSLENLTKDGCQIEIEEFFNLYVYEVTVFDPVEVATRKRNVQYCARKFDFDKLIYAKTRKRLFVLAGYSNDQGTGTPRESVFRINLPPSYKP